MFGPLQKRSSHGIKQPSSDVTHNQKVTVHSILKSQCCFPDAITTTFASQCVMAGYPPACHGRHVSDKACCLLLNIFFEKRKLKAQPSVWRTFIWLQSHLVVIDVKCEMASTFQTAAQEHSEHRWTHCVKERFRFKHFRAAAYDSFCVPRSPAWLQAASTCVCVSFVLQLWILELGSKVGDDIHLNMQAIHVKECLTVSESVLPPLPLFFRRNSGFRRHRKCVHSLCQHRASSTVYAFYFLCKWLQHHHVTRFCDLFCSVWWGPIHIIWDLTTPATISPTTTNIPEI